MVPPGTSKLSRGLRGRRHSHRTLMEWGEGVRDPGRPTVWAHASSVGEALQARAVLDAVRELAPGLQVVFTHFSPSAEGVVARLGAQVSAYLPWDLPEVVGPVLDAVEPELILFTQKEVWPPLAAAAAARDVPTALVAATLPDDAGRLGRLARTVLAPAFGNLALVAAISADDGERFGRMGVPAGRVAVTGDPGVDSACLRAAGADATAPHLALFHATAGPVLVAGSTWAADEAVLLPALARVRRECPDLRVVIAPHEPVGWDFDGLGARLADQGWSSTLLVDAEKRGVLEGADAVLVERVGVLAELYTVASIAYVGGGFHRHGLHSVLEPAAAGVPVAFGPRHRNSLAASRLVQQGGARSVDSSDALAAAFAEWLRDPATRKRDGARALAYIGEHRGAARRTAELLVAHLPERP